MFDFSKYGVPQKRKDRLSFYAHNRFSKDLLEELLSIHKSNRIKDKNCSMIEELGEVIQIMLSKVIGAGRFRGYTEEWKIEMGGTGLLYACKYLHNFNPKKSNDPTNYINMILHNGILQGLKKLKNYHQNFGERVNENSDESDNEKVSEALITNMEIDLI